MFTTVGKQCDIDSLMNLLFDKYRIITMFYRIVYVVLLSTCICFIDKNECAIKKGGCAHNCTNFDGGFTCGCNDGFQLMKDKKGCKGKCLCTYLRYQKQAHALFITKLVL